jgi:glycosyltransferase involved in cell wall biosynthesis
MLVLAIFCACLAWLPVAVLLTNRRLYRPLPDTAESAVPCAVLIPARNEAHNLPTCLESLLADPNPALCVWVLDDHSTDGTAAVVQMLAARDSRLQLLRGAPLPAGWGGKMFACHQLATAALQTRPKPHVLLFVDADVEVQPGTVGRVISLLQQQPHLGLLSGVPKQLASSAGERWLVHNIMLVLIGYLPMWMLRGPRTSVAAGCGQFMAFTAAAYSAVGGHAAYRASVHDGVHFVPLESGTL